MGLQEVNEIDPNFVSKPNQSFLDMTKVESAGASRAMNKNLLKRFLSIVTGPRAKFDEPKKYAVMEGDPPPVTLDEILGKTRYPLNLDPIDFN